MLLRALRFVIGTAVAFAIWWYATPAYNGVLCDVLRPFGVQGEAVNRVVRVSRPDTTQIQVPADQLTYNVVLFAGLVAAVPTRKVWRLIVALVVLLAIHPLALAVTIERTLAPQSQFWMSLDFLYRLGGMFAVAFVCWYAATYGAPDSQRKTPKKFRRSRQNR